MNGSPNIGLFGGAFDPPHLGHRHILLQAAKSLGVSQWLIMPTGQAVHREATRTPAHHRLRMCELAFSHLPDLQVDVSDFEIKQDKPNYTVDTLLALKVQYPDRHWFVLVGQDQWVLFKSWKNWSELLDMAQFVIAQRDDNPVDDIVSHTSMSFDRSFKRLPIGMKLKPHPASSTILRQDLSKTNTKGQQHPWLEPTVQSYITEHHLYSGTT